MFNDKSMTDTYISIRSRLMKSVSRIVPPKDIEDIVQETYVRVCQIENGSNIKYPHSFLFKTARNLALDHVKRAESRLTTGVVDEDEFDLATGDEWTNDPYHAVSTNGEFALFCEAVRQLPVQCRKVFVLKKVYGYSQKEISRALGIAESTVEKHISTGVKRCAQLIMKSERESERAEGDGPGSDDRSKKIVSMNIRKRGAQ